MKKLNLIRPKLLKNLFLITLSSALILSGCKKDEEENNSNTNEAPQQNATVFPNVNDGAGVLVAVKTKSVQETPIGPMDILFGTAIAVFYADGNYDQFVSAGNVSVNDFALTKQSNSSYIGIPSATQPMGIEFENDVKWNVSGNGTVPSIDHVVNANFPNIGDINSSTTVSKSAGYTLSCTSVTSADSVIFSIGGVMKTIAGNATSCEFSATELDGLANGTSMLQITPYKITSEMISGSKFYFVNQTVISKSATISN